jgi:hypothetical protein
MTRFLKLLFLTITFYSCNQEQHIKYYWVSVHGHEYEKSDTTQIIRADKSQNGDTAKFSYVTKFGSMNYFIIKDKDSSFIISNPKDSLIHPNDSIVFIRSFFDTSIILNNDTFKIKKYILDEFVTDGASIHYYEPTLGIFAAHSDTWPGLRYLQTNDTTLNKEIDALIKATVPKFFIRGKLETNSE